MKTNTNWKLSGEGLVVVIILLALIGGGLWYLYSTKAATDRETRLGPQAKLDLPPSQRDYMIRRFTHFGVPSQPIQIDESVTLESYFFEPRGIFTAHLNYPAQGATLQLATSHPVSRWQIDNITFTAQPAR